jgi:hypothetical protein
LRQLGTFTDPGYSLPEGSWEGIGRKMDCPKSYTFSSTLFSENIVTQDIVRYNVSYIF